MGVAGAEPAATGTSAASRLRALLAFDIWRTDVRGERRALRWAVAAARLISVVVAGVGQHQFTTRAAALTFTTVFGLVPTLAVGFAMFKAFGGLDDAMDLLLPLIVDYLAVGVREQVTERIEEMLATIHGGAIGAVGSLFMFAAVASLLNSIEEAFNEIWGVKHARSLVRRITGYWAVVTVTPVLLIAGVSLPAMLQRLDPVEWALAHATWVTVVLARLFPLLLICSGFSLLYGFLTAARVPVRAAVAGGCIAGVSWLIAVSAYTAYAGRSDFYATVYGPLAAIPIFLFWLYVSWVIVLIGAQFAFATENVGAYRDALLADDATPAERELLALGAMAHIAARFAAGEAAPRRIDLRRRLQTSGRLLNQVLQQLIDAGFLYEVDDGNAVAPAHDPRATLAADVVAALRGKPRPGNGTSAILQTIEVLRGNAEAGARAAWAGVTCHDLGERVRDAPEDRAD